MRPLDLAVLKGVAITRTLAIFVIITMTDAAMSRETMLKIRAWVETRAILAIIRHQTVHIDLVDLILRYRIPIPLPQMRKVVIVPLTGDILATVATKDDVPEGEVIETPRTLRVQVKMTVQDDHLTGTKEAKHVMT